MTTETLADRRRKKMRKLDSGSDALFWMQDRIAKEDLQMRHKLRRFSGLETDFEPNQIETQILAPDV